MSLATRSGMSSTAARSLVLNRSQWLARGANGVAVAGQRREISIQALEERKGGASSVSTYHIPSYYRSVPLT